MGLTGGDSGTPSGTVRRLSVAVCCHNSASRIEATLRHLMAQDLEDPWEVVVVDNGSTDGTGVLARKIWDRRDVPLRVVAEPRLGLASARTTAFLSAASEVVAFVDDDNWLEPEYLRLALGAMSANPEVGALGGVATALPERSAPPWLEAHLAYYACGPQAAAAGALHDRSATLYGAGLVVRVAAWRSLRDAGFEPSLTGRQGRRLTSGEDLELTLALRLAGWGLWYEPRMRLTHYLPSSRLRWTYLLALAEGNGSSSVHLDPLFALVRDERPARWLRQVRWALGESALLRVRQKLPEGTTDALVRAWHRGRLRALVGHPRSYVRARARSEQLAERLHAHGKRTR